MAAVLCRIAAGLPDILTARQVRSVGYAIGMVMAEVTRNPLPDFLAQFTEAMTKRVQNEIPDLDHIVPLLVDMLRDLMISDVTTRHIMFSNWV